MAVNARYRNPSGITSRIGVLLIAAAVLIMGVVVYAVWNQSQEVSPKPFAILVDGQIAIKQGIESPLHFNIQSVNSTDSIAVTVSASEGITAQVVDSQIAAGAEGTVTLVASSNAIEGTVTLTAKQGDQEASATTSIRIVPAVVNTSTNSTNTSSNSNTSTVDADHLRFIDKDLRVSFVYPITWGKALYPELIRMKPVSGKITHVRYENLERIDLAGHSFVSAASDDYTPSVLAGTPFYFAGALDPTLPLDRITQQVQAAGFRTYKVEIVELDGKKAVKMYYYRYYTHHFLDVAYLYPYPKSEGIGTFMMSRTIERIGYESLAEDQAFEMGRGIFAKLQDLDLSSDSLRRYREFEDAVATLQFIQ